MSDENDLIKDTTAWTLARICSFFGGGGTVITPETLPQLIQVFHQGLNEHPSIASHICWAIHNLSLSFPATTSTSPLSQYFQDLVTALLKISEQVDEPKLVSNSFTAITELINNSSPDCNELLPLLLQALLQRLNGTFQIISSGQQQTHGAQVQVQGLICGAFSVLLRKMRPETFEPLYDQTMTLMLHVVHNASNTGSAAPVLEDAMLAISTIADVAGLHFFKYFVPFKPYLTKALNNAEDHYVCQNAVIALQSIATAVKENLIPHGDELILILLSDVQNSAIDRSVKPYIIQCLADLATVMGPYFERYVGHVMPMLVQAAEIKLDQTDVDDNEWLNALRESVLDAFSCVLAGLAFDPQRPQFIQMYLPYLEKIYAFMEEIARDTNFRSESLLRKAVGLVRDIARDLAGQPRQRDMLAAPAVTELIRQARESKNPRLAKDGHDATQEVKKATGS